MSEPRVRIAHVSEIATPAPPEPGGASWRAVRHAFGIRSFGVSAYVAEAAGDVFTSEHDELDTNHEELFFVASGHASFTVGGETFDAPTGTFVYVRDPALARAATAAEPGTTLLAIGGEPGEAYEVSTWERKYLPRG
jgi:hypothetical protein